MEEKWASFFYDANVLFNVDRHAAFVEGVNATALAGFNYKPPSYNALRTTLIESKKMEVEAKVKKATSFSIETYGISLCSDGWDNVVHRPLMNIMLSCPASDIFQGPVDISGNKKTKKYFAGELKKFIEQIGPMKVSQICTDNAANMLGVCLFVWNHHVTLALFREFS